MSTSVKLLVSLALVIVSSVAYVGPANFAETVADARALLAFADWDDGWNDSPENTSFSGCTDPSASNYDMSASIDNGSCQFDVGGCMDMFATNYNPSATYDNGMCDYYQSYGCTDFMATNFDVWATYNDGSCVYERVYGCTDSTARNYNPLANVDDGTCEYDVYGCMNSKANNYNSQANIDDGSCTFDTRCETREMDMGSNGASFNQDQGAISDALQGAFAGLTGIDPSDSQVEQMSSQAGMALRDLSEGKLKVGVTFCMDFDGNWKLQVVTPISN